MIQRVGGAAGAPRGWGNTSATPIPSNGCPSWHNRPDSVRGLWTERQERARVSKPRRSIPDPLVHHVLPSSLFLQVRGSVWPGLRVLIYSNLRKCGTFIHLAGQGLVTVRCGVPKFHPKHQPSPVSNTMGTQGGDGCQGDCSASDADSASPKPALCRAASCPGAAAGCKPGAGDHISCSITVQGSPSSSSLDAPLDRSLCSPAPSPETFAEHKPPTHSQQLAPLRYPGQLLTRSTSCRSQSLHRRRHPQSILHQGTLASVLPALNLHRPLVFGVCWSTRQVPAAGWLVAALQRVFGMQGEPRASPLQ